MMRCAITGLPLCEACSDPVELDELVVDYGDPYHDECAPAPARELVEARA
jgi:hypothetical protein